MTHLNQLGASYTFTAVGSRSDYEMLPENAANYMAMLNAEVSKQWELLDRRPFMSDVRGCLVRLSGFLLQTKRVAEHAQALAKMTAAPSATSEPPYALAISG